MAIAAYASPDRSPLGALTPTLRLDGATESDIAPRAFRMLLEDHLRHGLPAWDPYRLDR